MDGSNRETLVDFGTVAWPNGLALDLQGLLVLMLLSSHLRTVLTFYD